MVPPVILAEGRVQSTERGHRPYGPRARLRAFLFSTPLPFLTGRGRRPRRLLGAPEPEDLEERLSWHLAVLSSGESTGVSEIRPTAPFCVGEKVTPLVTSVAGNFWAEMMSGNRCPSREGTGIAKVCRRSARSAASACASAGIASCMKAPTEAHEQPRIPVLTDLAAQAQDARDVT